MESSISAAQPVIRRERIQTIDIIRGFALLGILMMNIPYFGAPTTQYARWITLSHDSIDFQTFAVVEVVFEGTMRALFSMLFGAGALLFLAKREQPDSPNTVTDYFYRRLLWLVGFGLFNAYVLLWPGDILYTYGICGLVLFPFRKVPARSLVWIGAVMVLFMFGKSVFKRTETQHKRAEYLTVVRLEKQKKKLTDEQQEAKTAWLNIEKETKVDTKKEAKILAKMAQGYGTIFAKFLPINAEIESVEFYNEYFFDALALMFFGMALFKWGFFSNQLPTRTYWLLLLAGYGIGLTLGWLSLQGRIAWSHNPGAVVDAGGISFGWFYHVRRAATAVGHASLLLLLHRSGVVGWLMQALSNVGQMAFSNYLMQSMICTLFFYGYGLGYYGKLAYHELYFVVAAVWLFQLIFSSVWLRFYRFGPFEWLWRSLTYWKRQPMQM